MLHFNQISSVENAIYLGIKEQKELGYNFVEQMPYGNYARKSIGHLYAIQHGAKYIYETDDDNHPSDGKLHFHETFKDSYYVYNTNRSVVNAYESWDRVQSGQGATH